MRTSSTAISKSLTLRLLTLALSYSVSLLIFQRGLLVKRHVLPHRSSCFDLVTNESRQCWTEARFNKVILLIVDALRFDFIFPAVRRDFFSQYYIGQMPLVSKLLKSSNAGLFVLLSDAPTTTFQRIKALVTGSVPAFIEASDNFGGFEIDEDNLIDQLISRKRNVTMLGDDTWLQLLPDRFNRHFGGPSFDIKDLDTVDQIVIDNIYDELCRTDWSLLIAHCLGVDHAGHRYGPMHPEMSRKLAQMDQLVWNITNKMPDDAILFVLGDHGMTQTGDHGGDSFAEVTSALFVYAPGLNASISTNHSNISTVHQVDLVPTLSLLLDVPIPFSNLGHAIEPLLSENSLRGLRLNSFQLIRYAQQYFFHQPQMQEKLRQIIRQHEASADDSHSNVVTINAIQKLLRLSLDQFHFPVCIVGLISLLETILFNGFLLLDNAEEWISMRLWVFRSALLFLQLSLVFADDPSIDTVIFSVTSLVVSLFSQTMVLSYKLFGAFSNKNSSLSLCLTLSFTFVLSLLPLSNSFVIYESDVLRFSLQSVAFVLLLWNLNKKRFCKGQIIIEEVSCAFALLFITRLLKDFEKCREEQVGCLPIEFAKGSAFLLSVLFALIVIWALFEQNPPGHFHFLTKAFVWPMVVLLILHWAFELSALTFVDADSTVNATETSTRFDNLPEISHNLIESVSRRLAQVVFIAFFVHLFALRCLQKSYVSTSSWVWPHFIALSVPLMMLAGYSYGLVIALTLVAFASYGPLTLSGSVWTNALLFHLLGSLTFYATGHHQTLNAIPWHAAFVGLPGNFPVKWLSALLIVINMFPGKMLASLLIFSRENGDTAKGPLCLLLFGGMRAYGSLLAALIHHKHLMFFKVFAPKFVFDAAEFIFCCALIVFWTILRVRHAKI